MFDHLYDDFKSTIIEGQMFEIKWTKDMCEKKDYMNVQVGPITIKYQNRSRTEILNKMKPEECFVHRGFNKQYKERYQ